MLVYHGNVHAFAKSMSDTRSVYLPTFYSGTSSEDSLIITTVKPTAVQRVSWNPQEVSQTGTNMVSKMAWIRPETCR